MLLNVYSFFRGMAQLASVLAWGASGRQFESDYPDEQKSSPVIIWDGFF